MVNKTSSAASLGPYYCCLTVDNDVDAVVVVVLLLVADHIVFSCCQ